MRTCSAIAWLCLMIIQSTYAQVPPRLQIPGAVLVGAPPQRAQQFRQARLLDAPIPTPIRVRRPHIPNAVPLPIKEVRPVIEEPEEAIPQPALSNFDDEVNKLGLSVLQSAVSDAVSSEDDNNLPNLRPQKPIPVLRENIRENVPRPVARPAPVLRTEPIARPLPVLRAEPIARPTPQLRAEPSPITRGPVFREDIPQRRIKQQEYREELPVVRPQPIRQPARPIRPTPRPYDDEDDGTRKRKPVVQILRKYRTDNPDGSITWGFENEDGTFKEETLGIDCVTRGKYGYIDPDGVKREYNYETGNKCDQQPLEEDEEILQRKQIIPQPRKPAAPQFRPQPGLQYAN